MKEHNKTINLYFHASSKNHGCEAIIRSTAQILNNNNYVLYSSHPQDDIYYGIDKIMKVNVSGKPMKRYEPYHFISAFCLRVLKDASLYCKRVYKNIYTISNQHNVVLSIGGDNYSYGFYPQILSILNRKLNKKGIKTVLWGCSIEPELLKNKNVVNDLKRYSLITARESITYNSLLEAGIIKNTKLYPDPAFQLEKIELALPAGFEERNTIGVNVSPLIMNYEKNTGMAFLNYEVLLQHIIDTTDMQIALIPHVILENNDDRVPLEKLYNKFKKTGRVIIIPDHNCLELKGYIARCRMFIGARTHATIAAYSACIPTLVVGYSVKSKGITKDIFGTYDNYVILVQSLEKEDDLINSFEWLKANESAIREHLKNFMPVYSAKAFEAGKEISKLMGENP